MDRIRYRLIIPAAGIGKRFADVGYTDPKPYILVDGVRMLDLVIRNVRSQLGFDIPVTVVLRDDLGPMPFVSKDVDIVRLGAVTSGAAETVKLGMQDVDDDVRIIICNCDQVVTFDGPDFLDALSKNSGAILTFEEPSLDPKWSYAEIVEGTDRVVRVAEKVPISTHATVGVYAFANRSIAMDAIDSMIAADDRCNGEFYLCPSFNYVTGVVVRSVNRMWGIGTPNDLHAALTNDEFMAEVAKIK